MKMLSLAPSLAMFLLIIDANGRLQIEARQKRRLEDDYALLENRRVLRQNFVAQALKPSSTRAIEGPAHGGASGVVRGVGGGGEGGRGHLGGYAGVYTDVKSHAHIYTQRAFLQYHDWCSLGLSKKNPTCRSTHKSHQQLPDARPFCAGKCMCRGIIDVE